MTGQTDRDRLLSLLHDAYVVAKRIAKAGSEDAGRFADLLAGGDAAAARRTVGQAWSEHGPWILAFCRGETVLRGQELRACVARTMFEPIDLAASAEEALN